MQGIEKSMVNVVIGTPIFRKGSYVLDKFLTNQQQIQNIYPSSELVFATCEKGYVATLESKLSSHGLKGTVLHYDIKKPSYSQSNIWNITSGRETIRNYTYSKTNAKYLLFLDADMTFDPEVVTIMEQQIQGYGAAFSGYPLRDYGIGLAGAGCLMLTREILDKINFRCHEFKNGEVIFEDNILEMDLFRIRSRFKKGFFVSIEHYRSATEVKHIKPQQVGLLRKIANFPLLRYLLIRMSIMIRYNIPWKLKVIRGKRIFTERKK
jgi:hypothetical protein